MALLAIKEWAKHIAAKAMEEYKTSDDFRSDIAEDATFAYYIRFKDCLKKVKESCSEVDLSCIVPR